MLFNPTTGKLEPNARNRVKRTGDTMTGVLTAPGFVSTVGIGTQPYTATSTTLNSNLNADLLDGQHANEFSLTGHNHDLAYLGISAKAADSDLLDGHDTSYFQVAGSYLTAEVDTLATVTSRGAIANVDVDFRGNTNANIILSTNGNNTIYTANVAFRRMTGGGLGIDSPASVFINLDTDDNSVFSGQFAVRSNASTTNIFYVKELIAKTGGVGSQFASSIEAMGGNQTTNYYNLVSAFTYNQNYSIASTGNGIPNLMGMWLYTSYSSGFNSGETVAEGAGTGGIHYMAGATGTVTKGIAMLGWVWSGSGTVSTASSFTARSLIQSTGTVITTLYGFEVEDLVSNTGSPTLPTTHVGFYVHQLTQATNNYGIYLEDFTDTTNDYALYSAGGRAYLGGELHVAGDIGGKASTNSLTGVSDLTGNSTGVGTILFKGATSRNSSGFIKIYIGTTAYYVPVFSAITG